MTKKMGLPLSFAIAPPPPRINAQKLKIKKQERPAVGKISTVLFDFFFLCSPFLQCAFIVASSNVFTNACVMFPLFHFHFCMSVREILMSRRPSDSNPFVIDNSKCKEI